MWVVFFPGKRTTRLSPASEDVVHDLLPLDGGAHDAGVHLKRTNYQFNLFNKLIK
jgi:hypothetical protein